MSKGLISIKTLSNEYAFPISVMSGSGIFINSTNSSFVIPSSVTTDYGPISAILVAGGGGGGTGNNGGGGGGGGGFVVIRDLSGATGGSTLNITIGGGGGYGSAGSNTTLTFSARTYTATGGGVGGNAGGGGGSGGCGGGAGSKSGNGRYEGGTGTQGCSGGYAEGTTYNSTNYYSGGGGGGGYGQIGPNGGVNTFIENNFLYFFPTCGNGGEGLVLGAYWGNSNSFTFLGYAPSPSANAFITGDYYYSDATIPAGGGGNNIINPGVRTTGGILWFQSAGDWQYQEGAIPNGFVRYWPAGGGGGTAPKPIYWGNFGCRGGFAGYLGNESRVGGNGEYPERVDSTDIYIDAGAASANTGSGGGGGSNNLGGAGGSGYAVVFWKTGAPVISQIQLHF